MSFICGSFHHRQEEDEDDFDVLWGAANSPSRSSCKIAKRMNSFCSKNKGSKNPYADRGLDKFSKLLADLDHKKQQIFTQKGSEDISFVRFVYTPNSNDATPIVVKGKLEKKPDPKIVSSVNATKATHKSRLDQSATLPSNKSVINVSRDQNIVQPSRTSVELAQKSDDQKAKKKVANSTTTWEFLKLETWKRPSYYLPLFLVLILIFLAVFGRSFAILCTSIGWYVIPSINGSENSMSKSSSKGPKRMKKEYARKISEKVSSPRSVLNGPMSDEDGTRRRSF